MTENNKCFKKLSLEHQQLWLNIHQNVNAITLFWEIDYGRYMCNNCFVFLGSEHEHDIDNNDNNDIDNNDIDNNEHDINNNNNNNNNKPKRHFHNDAYCCKYTIYTVFCNKCLKSFNVNTDNNTTWCPVCWYFQIKNCKDCSKHNYKTPPISLDDWKLADLSTIFKSYKWNI